MVGPRDRAEFVSRALGWCSTRRRFVARPRPARSRGGACPRQLHRSAAVNDFAPRAQQIAQYTNEWVELGERDDGVVSSANLLSTPIPWSPKMALQDHRGSTRVRSPEDACVGVPSWIGCGMVGTDHLPGRLMAEPSDGIVRSSHWTSELARSSRPVASAVRTGCGDDRSLSR